MENKNGQGIFYGVIGVATLVVAIIGATFAYFSASTSAGDGTIQGQTLDVQGTALSLEVTPVAFENTQVANKKLVPADITESVAGYGAAVNAKCEDATAGYTGCHLYQVKVTSGSNLPHSTLTLNVTNDANAKGNWKYAVYQSATPTAAGTTPNSLVTGSPVAFTTTSYNVFSDATLNSGDTYYYLLVYLKNINASQNGQNDVGETNPGTPENATGSYSGTFTLSAGGGQVKATFASA